MSKNFSWRKRMTEPNDLINIVADKDAATKYRTVLNRFFLGFEANKKWVELISVLHANSLKCSALSTGW